MILDNASRQRVLIVDDEEQLVEFLKYILEERNFEVVTAYNGLDALEILKMHQINFVLSDITMPGLTGLELLSKVRRQNIAAPFIFLTGNSSSDSLIKAVRLGATDFILKPFELDDLDRVIRRVSAMASRFEQIDELLRSIGQDVAPKTHAEINDLRRQINLLRTMS
jgi:DNA-binding NtrC family response regulator